MKLSPSEGEILISLLLKNGEKGSCPFGGTSFNFKGTVTGTQNSANEIEFSEAGSDLIVLGTPASMVGTSKVETTGGNRLVLAP